MVCCYQDLDSLHITNTVYNSTLNLHCSYHVYSVLFISFKTILLSNLGPEIPVLILDGASEWRVESQAPGAIYPCRGHFLYFPERSCWSISLTKLRGFLLISTHLWHCNSNSQLDNRDLRKCLEISRSSSYFCYFEQDSVTINCENKTPTDMGWEEEGERLVVCWRLSSSLRLCTILRSPERKCIVLFMCSNEVHHQTLDTSWTSLQDTAHNTGRR